jgi:hypothetical protein
MIAMDHHMTSLEMQKPAASARWTKLWAIACFAIAFGVLLGTLSSAHSENAKSRPLLLAEQNL